MMARPLSIAILLNGYDSPYKSRIRESFETAIQAATSPDRTPTITFFDPIIAQIYPEPGQHDLIVLSGGTEDPMGTAPWILKMRNFLRTIVNKDPQQKILGICWGHQIICVTFGGEIGSMEMAELGVTKVQMTREGQKMFPFFENRPLRIHEFHKRDIKIPAKGFIKLAEANQAYINDKNTVLTFQGHPELNAALAAVMLEKAPSYMEVEGTRKQESLGNVKQEHDGIQIWKRIISWIDE